MLPPDANPDPDAEAGPDSGPDSGADPASDSGHEADKDPGPPGKDSGPPNRNSGDDAGPPSGGEGPPGGDTGPPSGGDPGPPDGDAGPPPVSIESLSYFWKFLQPDAGRFWLATALSVIISSVPVAMMLVPYLLSEYWRPESMDILIMGLLGILGLQIIALVLRYGNGYLMASVAEGVVRRLQLAIFSKIGSLPAQAMSGRAIGEWAQRSTGDVMRIRELVTPGLVEVVTHSLRLVFVTIALFVLNPFFSTIILFVLLVCWFLVRWANVSLMKWARRDQLQHELLLTKLIESVGGYRDLVASGRFHHIADEYEKDLRKKQEISIRTSIWNITAQTVPAAAAMGLIFAYYFLNVSDSQVLADDKGWGPVLSFVGLIGITWIPLGVLFNVWSETALSMPSLYEVRRLLDAPEIKPSLHSRNPADATVTFDDVTFGYSPHLPLVLKGVSLTIEPGTFGAIVGQSGSGKTTLFYLLLRLLETKQGQIRIGGVPLADVGLAELREFIGFIPQSPFIFRGTFRENLLLGLPDDQIAPERIDRAIELAQLSSLVVDRGGLDTPIGDISAGQRQRIALARVFIRDPKIIVCDEYTANIDNETALLIHDALHGEFSDCTRIVISHQLYTLRGADKLYILDDGMVVEQGSHEELLARDGLYRQMWEVQRLQ